MPNRTIVFVGHANPEDNTFAQWLSLRLASLGYQVWSDVTKLLGGEDFWRDIELIIRNEAAKYVYVLSRSSNQKLGTLQEVRVANATAKRDNLRDFVIPLRIDGLPHDKINIEIGRLNAIEFRDWALGLTQLCEKLEVDGVPRNPLSGAETVRHWWDRECAPGRRVTGESEVHYSNWYPLRLPPYIHRYSVMGLVEGEPRWKFPTRWHELRLVSFASEAEIESGLGTLRLDGTEKLKITDFLSRENSKRGENRDLVIGLLREAWEQYTLARGLKKFEMASGRPMFYFDIDALPNPNVSFLSVNGTKTYRGLMGYKTRKSGLKRHWHFAISARPAVHPQPILQVRAHVLFSEDGRTIWSSAAAMHRARRSQCKNWWNDDWRDRILASMAWLAEGGESLGLTLSAGSANAVVAARPLEFVSPVTLVEPSAARSEEDVEEASEEEDDGPFEEAEAAEVEP